MRPAHLRAERNRIASLCHCPPVVELPILLSSDTTAEDLPAPPEPQQPALVVVDLKSSLEELPDLDLTQEFPPPLRHQVLHEAYVLLERLQEPRLQPLTQPPEPPLRPLTPPPEPEVDWVGLEDALANFDAPQLPVLQQPEVVLHPQFEPLQYTPPQPRRRWTGQWWHMRCLLSLSERASNAGTT